MDMNQLLPRSVELEARVAEFLGLPLFDESSRLQAVRSVASCSEPSSHVDGAPIEHYVLLAE